MFGTFFNNTTGGYAIERSLRFSLNQSSSLSRTYGNGDNRTFTVSAWVKRTPSNSSEAPIIGCREDDSNRDWFGFENDELVAHHRVGNTPRSAKVTDRKFRDFSAWYHIVYAFNSTLSVQNDRTKFYVNGVRQTVSTYNAAVGSNDNVTMNKNNVVHYVGVQNLFQGGWADMYLAETHFIDGQEKDADDFGEFNDNGIWVPKPYSGTYGTTGWYLDFKNNANTTTLGYDAAGSNNWTLNNFSVTSGVDNDSVVDSPTDNYAIMNILTKYGATTIRNGGLHVTHYYGANATVGMPEGKYYFEFEIGTVNDEHTRVGINRIDAPYNDSTNWVVLQSNGNIQIAEVTQTSISSLSSGDVVGIAFNADTRACSFYVNGTLGATVTAPVVDGVYAPHCGFGAGSVDVYFNAGQQPFQETEPTGFDKRVRTADLPDPTIEVGSTYFDAITFSGNGTSLSVTGLEFSPDLVWTKERQAGFNSGLYDTVRGATKGLTSNETDSEYTNTESLKSFDSNGFTLGNWAGENSNTAPYAAWVWDAGSSTASNTDGSITSSVRASQASGFSIVSYTGNSTVGSTVGHGLNAQPSLVIIKNRDRSTNWVAGCLPVDGFSSGKQLYLNESSNFRSSENFFNNTDPTSSVFTVKDNYEVNYASEDYIAYCWAPVEGYSAFGMYEGNGQSDGPFIFTGFRPRFIILKLTDSTGDWRMFDTERDPYNVSKLNLFANLSDTEGGSDGVTGFDILSNGFKIRVSHPAVNPSGGDFFYMAFAEHPFKYANAR